MHIQVLTLPIWNLERQVAKNKGLQLSSSWQNQNFPLKQVEYVWSKYSLLIGEKEEEGKCLIWCLGSVNSFMYCKLTKLWLWGIGFFALEIWEFYFVKS